MIGKLNKHTPLAAGLAIIIVTNAVALVGAAYNRSGEADAIVELTERELSMPYRYDLTEENSGVSLTLRWRTDIETLYGLNFFNDLKPSWLTNEKLAEVGFDTSAPLDDAGARNRYKKMLPRKAYLVLEYDGASYEAAVNRSQNKLNEEQALLRKNPDNVDLKRQVKNARDNLDSEKHKNSRLFVIDAGHDKDALRTRYPDRNKYLILQGEIGLRVDENRKDSSYTLTGYVKGISIDQINVPHEYHALIEEVAKQSTGWRNIDEPRYAVQLATGKRAEPWIMEITPIKTGGDK